MIKVIDRFLDDEITDQEMYEAIYEFVVSGNIRNGEFEANAYIIKKMDYLNFIIFPEDIYPDNHREISYCTSIYRNDLISKINEHAKKEELKVIE